MSETTGGRCQLHDLTGQRFGHLVVLRRGRDYVSPSGVHRVKWVCQCDCGAETEVLSASLLHGSTTTCGFCYTRGTKLTTSDGETHTVAEWAVLTDIPHHRIWTRIRAGWSPDEVVGRKPHTNKNGVLVTNSAGETHSMAEWARMIGINPHTLRSRLEDGWPIDKALTRRKKGLRHSQKRLYTVYLEHGHHALVCQHSDVHEASEAMGITVATFRSYLKQPTKKWNIIKEWL